MRKKIKFAISLAIMLPFYVLYAGACVIREITERLVIVLDEWVDRG